MLKTVKYLAEDLRDFWNDGLIAKERKQIKYWLLMYVIPLMTPITTFVHESGHAVVGMLYGLEIREFVVGFTGGKTVFILDEVLALSPLQVFLLLVIGGVMESLMYYILGKKVFRGFYVGIVERLPYGIWEGLKGLLLVSEPSVEICSLHAAALEPIVTISFLLAMGILAYKAWRG